MKGKRRVKTREKKMEGRWKEKGREGKIGWGTRFKWVINFPLTSITLCFTYLQKVLIFIRDS